MNKDLYLTFFNNNFSENKKCNLIFYHELKESISNISKDNDGLQIVAYSGEDIPLKLEKDIIPNHIKTLILSVNRLEIGAIPNSVLYLTIDASSYKLKPGDIPNTVKKLNICIKELEPGIIPFGVEKLDLIIESDYELKKGDLPNSIKHLIFGYRRYINDYDHPLKKGDIPNSVKYLELPHCYNHEIKKKVLPNGLEKIIFGFNFDQPCVIPKSVKYLEFGQNFNQSFYKKCILPENLIELKLGSRYNQPLIKVIKNKKIKLIPNNLKKLKFGFNWLPKFNKIKVNKDILPNSVSVLSINLNMIKNNVIPNNIIKLYLYINFKKSLKNVIPKSVEKLKLYFDNDLKLEIGDIPSNIKTLKIYNYKYELIKGIIPDSVNDLYIYETKIQDGAIPNTVKFLNISYRDIEQKLNNIIPNNLLSLEIDNREWNEYLYIPKSLLFLRLDKRNIDISSYLNHENLIEILTCDKNIIESKIMIGRIKHDYHKCNDYCRVKYYNLNELDICRYQKYDFDKYIKDIILNNKLIGQIIFEELAAYVYKPSRLLKLCNLYNLTFDEINDIY